MAYLLIVGFAVISVFLPPHILWQALSYLTKYNLKSFRFSIKGKHTKEAYATNKDCFCNPENPAGRVKCAYANIFYR